MDSAVALVVVSAVDSAVALVVVREREVSDLLMKNDADHAASMLQNVVVDLGAQKKGDAARMDGLAVDRQIRNSL